MKFDGDVINDGLHNFKVWFSDFAIELSPLLVLVGMLMTGVDIYLSGRLATQIWFEIPWAIAQVLAIDGLWFAVWLRILGHSHEKKVWPWLRFVGLAIVGLAMVVVAFIMNDIVLFQQVNGIASSVGVMATLGIPVAIFTHFRAGLLVVTATLAMLFSRKRHSQDAPKKATPKSTPKAMVAMPEVTVTQVTSPQLVALPAPAHSQEYEAIMAIMAMPGGREKSYKAISLQAQVGYSTVKKWAPKIRRELQGGNERDV